MKAFRLVFAYIKSLFLNNKALYIFFTVALTVTALGYMTAFSSSYQATMEYSARRISSRTYYLNFPSPPDNAEQFKLLLDKNEYVRILKTRYVFEAEISGEPFELCGYSVDDMPSVFMGRNFEKDDEKSIVMMPPNYCDGFKFDSAFPYIKKMELGSETELSGKRYTVIGYINLEEIIVPFETGVKNFPLRSLSIEISSEASEKEKVLFANYLRESFPQSELIEPEPIGQQTVNRMSLFIYGGLLIGISAFLTFIFLFVYIIGRNMKDYVILRIAGCSLKKMCLLITSQLALVYTVSFAAAFLAARFLNLFMDSESYIHFNISFAQAAVIYGITIFMMLLIFLPYAVSATKRTVAFAKNSE